MQIQTQIQLKTFNTLNLNSVASHYAEIHSEADLLEALAFAKTNQLNIFILSGGSNMLLPEQIHALVLHMHIMGIHTLTEDELSRTIRVGAGQVWHDFVLWTTAEKIYGLQNLALIPGLVGASPVQNIGAYGVEAGEFIVSVQVYDCKEQQFTEILAENCNFAYRHSIFKDDPNRYIICSVTFKLLKQPILKLQYGDLKVAVADDQTPENLQKQVIQIRQSKLPDPKEYPNVGSFFKNPVVSEQVYVSIANDFPTLPHYAQANGDIKIAAGWLIDQSGWKGKQLGPVGMFHKQALVLVNYAEATLQDVRASYQAVQHDVYSKFGIRLEPEPVLFDEQGLIRSHQD